MAEPDPEPQFGLFGRGREHDEFVEIIEERDINRGGFGGGFQEHDFREEIIEERDIERPGFGGGLFGHHRRF